MARHAYPFHRIARWLAVGILAAAMGVLVAAGGLYLYVTPGLPHVSRLQDVQLQAPLRIHAANGDLMAVFGAKRRVPVDIEHVPPLFRKAFIAAEDNRFYRHPGVDWMGIARAAWHLLRTGEKTQGGSTITMQVARNFFLTREKSYIRKIKEIFLALKIHDELSKNEVLELYLNKIYLGAGAYGIAAAARTYHGKTLDELTLAEMATIAGLPKAPSYYNPIAHPRRARPRRDYVLRQMHENGMIDETALRQALAAPVTASSHAPPINIEAPYLAEMARLEAVHRFGKDVDSRGYRVYTTVVPREQEAARASLRETLLEYEKRHGYEGPLDRVDARRLPSVERMRMLRTLGDERGGTTSPVPAHGRIHHAAESVFPPPAMLEPEELDRLLAGHARIGNLEPAVVLAVRERGAVVYRADAPLARMSRQSMAWAAHRRDGHESGVPDRASGVVAVGDIVHVTEVAGGNRVRLGQVPEVQGALVAIDPRDGAIRALTGGFDFEQSKFNRATQTRRQPGSSFKPFVYSAALNRDYTAATLVNDAPLVFDEPALEGKWRPQNYSGRIFGPTRLRAGLVHSRNLVSLRVLRDIGVPYTVDYVQRFGFSEEQLPHNLTLALGTASVSPLQLARGYAVFANLGYRVDPYLVTHITNSRGEVVYRARPKVVCRGRPASPTGITAVAVKALPVRRPVVDGSPAAEMPYRGRQRSGKFSGVGVPDRQGAAAPRCAPRVIDKRNAYLVRSFLRDVARRGTGRGTRVLGRDDIAGKTGTTDRQRDAWFAGFNSSLVATAWVGYDGRRTLGRSETGGRAALPMWVDFMRVALEGVPERWPPLPAGMVTVRIDPDTGDYATPDARDAMFEIFRAGKVPRRDSPDRRSPATHLF